MSIILVLFLILDRALASPDSTCCECQYREAPNCSAFLPTGKGEEADRIFCEGLIGEHGYRDCLYDPESKTCTSRFLTYCQNTIKNHSPRCSKVVVKKADYQGTPSTQTVSGCGTCFLFFRDHGSCKWCKSFLDEIKKYIKAHPECKKLVFDHTGCCLFQDLRNKTAKEWSSEFREATKDMTLVLRGAQYRSISTRDTKTSQGGDLFDGVRYQVTIQEGRVVNELEGACVFSTENSPKITSCTEKEHNQTVPCVLKDKPHIKTNQVCCCGETSTACLFVEGTSCKNNPNLKLINHHNSTDRNHR